LVRSGRSCCLPMYATPNCCDFIQFVAAAAAAAAAATNVATCQPASAAQNCFRLLRSTFHENIPALRSRFHSPVRNAHKKCCVQRPQAAQPSKPMPSHAPFRTNPPPEIPDDDVSLVCQCTIVVCMRKSRLMAFYIICRLMLLFRRRRRLRCHGQLLPSSKRSGLPPTEQPPSHPVATPLHPWWASHSEICSLCRSTFKFVV